MPMDRGAVPKKGTGREHINEKANRKALMTASHLEDHPGDHNLMEHTADEQAEALSTPRRKKK